MKKQHNIVVLAYSRGLDTSVLIPWLKENYGCEVISVSGDVGQKSELDGLEEKVLATGASYEDYLLGTSFARLIIAKN